MKAAEQLLIDGRVDLADDLLVGLLKHAPHRWGVHRLRAIAALMSNRPLVALQHAQAACTLAPQRADLVMLLGRAFKLMNDLPRAIDAYQRSLVLNPGLAEAHVSLGIARRAGGDVDGAIACYRRALSIAPDMAAAHAALGNALAFRLSLPGRKHEPVDSERLDALQRALELDPSSASAAHNLGVALLQCGQTEQAVERFNMALGLDHRREDTCVLLHAALSKMRLLPAARTCCERWLELNPPTPGVTNRLVTTLLALNELDAAIAWCKTAQELAPDMPELLHNQATVCLQSLDVDLAVVHLRRALQVAPGYRAARDVLLMSLNYVEEQPQTLLREHLELAPKSEATVQVTQGLRPSGNRRLRLGYVSGDLRRHSVSYFMEPVMASHDRSRFEVTAYHTGRECDEVSARLKSHVSNWVDAGDDSDDDLVERIRTDGIDVLVDLSGYTADGRLQVFARRPAPVQITYLGYPTTTGMASMDYRISDGVIDPPGDSTWSSEEVLRCRRGMFCYRPDCEPDIGPLPAASNGFITFGSFNNLAKVSAVTMKLWAGVLHAVPGSKLCLKALALNSERVRDRLLTTFAMLGVERSRVLLNPWRADLGSHLDAYRAIDIALDSFPYNGATTTCESLWMGVPVVTLRGATHVSRMGASILGSAGMLGWTASSAENFVAVAAHRARQIEALASFRATARAQLRASALMDATGHTSDLERLFLAAFEGRAQGIDRNPVPA